MNWYLTKIVYRVHCGDEKNSGQFDEQLRIIFAINKEKAFHKAKTIGQQEEEVFENEQQKMVHWQFINVCELYKLSELIDGAEIYSRIEEYDNAEAYIDVINKKAKNILSTNTLEILELV